MTICLELPRLERLLANELDPAAEHALNAHIETCADCQAALEELTANVCAPVAVPASRLTPEDLQKLVAAVRPLQPRSSHPTQVMSACQIKEALDSLDDIASQTGNCAASPLVVCASCARVRTPEGIWQCRDASVAADAPVTHGICPECGHQLYGDVWKRASSRPNNTPNLS